MTPSKCASCSVFIKQEQFQLYIYIFFFNYVNVETDCWREAFVAFLLVMTVYMPAVMYIVCTQLIHTKYTQNAVGRKPANYFNIYIVASLSLL